MPNAFAFRGPAVAAATTAGANAAPAGRGSLRGNELVMTQQLIANMLGVRREGVTAAAGTLQQQGLIDYRRGAMVVLDRKRLESAACACYGIERRANSDIPG